MYHIVHDVRGGFRGGSNYAAMMPRDSYPLGRLDALLCVHVLSIYAYISSFMYIYIK